MPLLLEGQTRAEDDDLTFPNSPKYGDVKAVAEGLQVDQMKRIAMIAVPLVFGVIAAAFCAETVPPKSEIESLVDQLVSPNSPPIETVPDTILPKGYNRDAQKNVGEAWKKLREIGLPAFPYLHARLDDERYCMTKDIGPYEENFSVGRVCRLVIETQLQPYAYHSHGKYEQATVGLKPQPCFFDNRLSTTDEFKQWWKTHKDRRLREVQIEVLEWTIEQVKQDNSDKSTKEFRRLTVILTDLRRSDKPLPAWFPFAK